MLDINPRRIRKLNDVDYINGPVIYWMSREQRVHDNWGLLVAQASAIKHKQPLIVVFCLQDDFLGATLRQFDFMLSGLEQVSVELKRFNIPFILKKGRPEEVIPSLIKKVKAGGIISDFSPLKISKEWHEKILKEIKIPLWQVDSHNIVPVWVASDKQEYSARTIRPKINNKLSEFLTQFPKISKHPYSFEFSNGFSTESLLDDLSINRNVGKINWLKSGERNALVNMEDFIENKLKYYSDMKNDPTKDALSNLSPYLHFGQISSQRIALEVNSSPLQEDAEVFLEELIIRKELADNYCNFNDNYDNFAGFPNWAQKTLNEHRLDKREFIYSLEQFEHAETHDEVWNAGQIEMTTTGKMHGYIRMYWAKKILEWTQSPEEAQEIAIKLNDKYELDGRDPNGYVGIAWSLGGLHDRPWFPRSVFGVVRYMSRNGIEKKFPIQEYVSKYLH
ncbi:MAG TPA: deoxyribodipyrimidine photo-lyase [Candidatus Dojkabacteria bacterium]|nr:deoxyribodipyrimidine photo-lyase [Candidatus Dojkabacteria bacterium]